MSLKTAAPRPGRRLGWSEHELATLPYARFWNPDMAPLPPEALQAVANSPMAEPLLPPMAAAVAAGLEHAEIESGWTLTSDGAAHVNLLTSMPGVTPAMIDWWFGWHGDAAAKYKLWHPQAHVHVAWRDTPPAAAGRARYIGQTSFVDEYIGSDLVRGAIRFVPPVEMGFTDRSLEPGGTATIVCARLGLADAPIDIGYLAHQVRSVPGGSEMRSRFWMGGRHVAGRNLAGSMAATVAKRVLRLTESDARNLLVHCGQEMPHLAAFLPALFAEFGDDA